MIPHHQVAVDISIMLQKTPRYAANSEAINLTQEYEIKMMEEMMALPGC